MTQWLVRRGLLATVPVASLVLAFGACSSEPDAPSRQGPSSQDTASQSPGESEVATTTAARDRVASLTKRFVRAPLPRLQAPAALPGAPAQPEPAPRPVLEKGVAERFLQRGDRIVPDVSAKLKADTLRAAAIELPRTADGFVRIQPEGSTIGIEFAAKGAKPGVAFDAADGLVSYAAAAPGGGDMVLRIAADAVEDFVVLETKPEHAFVDYAVNVSDIAGLRLYANVLEFLDAHGDPQIRVRPPIVVDAEGTGHNAKVELPDCKADDSPLPPWDRPVIAPQKSECTVRVSWEGAKVAYPAIVDPVWTTAGSLAVARYRNAAIKQNSNGFVLTCGGLDGNGDILASCEVFNPGAAAGVGSWATGPTMKKVRSQFTLLAIGNDVLAVGDTTNGAGATGYTSELLNAGTWTLTTSTFEGGGFSPPQLNPVLTTDNNWVVLVDPNGTPYRYSVASKAWTVGTSNAFTRYTYITLAVPGSGAIMRCGGYNNSSPYKTCEKYTPQTNTWIMPGAAGAISDMNAARGHPGWATIDSNRVMLYGGYNFVSSTYIGSSEIYSASTNAWVNVTGTIPNNFYEYNLHNTWALHGGSGRILSTTTYYPTVFDPPTGVWSQISTCDNTCFYTLQQEGAVASAGNKVLIVPVSPNGTYSPQTTCKLFDVGAQGATCTSTATCASGLTCAYDWYDGVSVCCDSDCGTNRCNACRATNKTSGTGDGLCGPRKTQQYVGYDFCPSTSSSTCGTTGGYCDGAGACEKWSSAYTCSNGSCVNDTTQQDTLHCTGQGACEQPSQSNCATGYKCMFDSQCYTYCNNDDYCQSGYYCNYWDPPYQECTAKKANGQACSSTSQCSSGNCVDGYCCDDACDGTCEACSNSLTGSTNGACKPVTVAAGAQFDCYDNGPSSCGQTGLCNGAGACQLYGSGTQCADIGSCATETARFVPDTCNGSGTCVDKGTANCASGYSCLNGACNTQCTSDAMCASNFWCDTANKVCVADRSQGASCARDAVCSGNANCIDSVCCDSGCAGSCRSCLKARTGLANDGTCGAILDDTDPENECTTGAAYPNSCAAPGLCNGAGACRPYAKNTIECDTDVCTGSTLTSYTCNGAGTCKAASTQCYPFKCDTTNNVCRVSCTVANQAQDCIEGSFCSNGTCVGQLENGNPCSDGAQCKTKFCANIGEGTLEGDDGAGGEGAGGAAGDPGTDSPGVCCNADCGATCFGCKASIKGYGSDGVCEAVRNNTDPGNDCEPAVGDLCGLNGECNGTGQCAQAPQGKACGETSCVGNAVLGQRCNGSGECIDNEAGTDCAPYVCGTVDDRFQCTNPCADDNDCRDGYYCSESQCLKKLANGKACDTSGICNSGYCVDALCCDTSCNGQCEACDAAGNEGVCTAVQGDPHGTRPACDHAGEECGGQCDGVRAESCKYSANGTSCGTPTCTNAKALSSSCDGQGTCRENKSQSCTPFNCGDDDTCLELCDTDDQCSQGYACDETTQRCLPDTVAAECSEDGLNSIGQNGINPCKPFLCVKSSGTCAVSCAFTTDCAPDFVCEASTKTCLPQPPDSTADEEGCACRAVGSTPARSNYLALVALGLALTGLRRRQRSRKSPARPSKPSRFESGPHPFE